MLNPVLLSSANQIIRTRQPAQFRITARFLSANTKSTFSFSPLHIEGITKNSDYLKNYGDEMDLLLMVSLKDYALMQDQGQDLRCVLTLSFVTNVGKDVFSPAPVSKQYYVIINNPRDVRAAVPDVQHYVTPSVPLSVRLVDPVFYKLRHTRINKLFQRCSVKDAILSIAQDLAIERIHLVDPDNTHVYDHIEIVSYQGVDSIFLYLHSKCGVYTHGCNSYISDGVLYVYPPFETAPVYDKQLIFYQVETGQFAGVPVYHKKEGKTISVVINSQPDSRDISIAGAENIGTGFVFTRASRLTDGFTSVIGGEAQFTDQPSMSVTLANSRTAATGQNNNFHIKATDNPYPAMSHLISHQASIMQVEWPHADLFAIDPGHAVSYYYDRNGVMLKKTGIVEHISYNVIPASDSDKKDIWTANGRLLLRLSPNETRVL